MEQLIGDRLRARLSCASPDAGTRQGAFLPNWLKPDASVRSGILRRLAVSRRFAHGDRAGALRSAALRSGRRFRMDVRQRVIVKAFVSRHASEGAARAAALMKHVSYLGRAGAGADGARPEFFDRECRGLKALDAVRGWNGDRHHFRFIVSPEHGDRIKDLPDYVREVMRRVGDDLGEPELTWIATAHFDTDQPHAHVLVRGRRGDGRDLVIPRAYIGYGFRARAQEVAQERLGDLSRQEAERRIWRETQADRFTGFDRRLIEARGADGFIADGVGPGPWPALLRGRLLHLQQLGLATRVGSRIRLAPDLESRLRGLQLRGDIIRTMNQRRLEAGRPIDEYRGGRVEGWVVKSGNHDELGASGFVIVRDAGSHEHYARTGLVGALKAPQVGDYVTLQMSERGATLAQALGQGRDLGR